MKLGIIGLARSGKTTIFNALTKRTGESVPSGGHAVPVLGAVSVADSRLDWLSEHYKPKKTTHAQVTYLDLQGLPGVLESHQEYMSLLLDPHASGGRLSHGGSKFFGPRSRRAGCQA